MFVDINNYASINVSKRRSIGNKKTLKHVC